MKPKEETTQLNVEIPADLHRKVKSDAALEGLKLHEFVIKIILERGQPPASQHKHGKVKRVSFNRALDQSRELELVAA
jgi:hypothetical protein